MKRALFWVTLAVGVIAAGAFHKPGGIQRRTVEKDSVS